MTCRSDEWQTFLGHCPRHRLVKSERGADLLRSEGEDDSPRRVRLVITKLGLGCRPCFVKLIELAVFVTERFSWWWKWGRPRIHTNFWARSESSMKWESNKPWTIVSRKRERRSSPSQRSTFSSVLTGEIRQVCCCDIQEDHSLTQEILQI